MLTIVNVVLPIFALMGVGYLAVRFRLYPLDGVRGLMSFVNNFATPCLLFQSMVRTDFSQAFNPAILVPFYAGAVLVLIIGTLTAIKVFGNQPGEGVASGFSAAFSNSVLIGFPLVHRAYGDPALPIVFSIVALHAPMLLTAGTIVMELVRRDGQPLGPALAGVGKRILQNPLLWGVASGVAVNLSGLHLPEPATASVGIMAGAVMPVALFGLGGALNEYRVADNWRQALTMALMKLVLHPAIAWTLMVPVLKVDPAIARYGVLMAGMPAGINVYLFALYYRRGTEVAASTMLLTTLLSMITVSAWLLFLG